MNRQHIFIFTGTSGSGRKTVAHRVCADTSLVHIPSCTDRPPRKKEQPDQDYHYLTSEQFDELERAGAFAERVAIDGFRYGVRTSEINSALASGANICLILNREGSDKIVRLYGDQVIRIFIYVDKQTVRERLESKGTAYEVVEAYLSHYTEEVSYRKQCKYVVENVSLSQTIEKIRAIISGY